MSISASIKALLNIRGCKQADLMDVLSVNSKQALSNKFTGERWSGLDLVKVAEFAGAKLAFVLPDGERLVIGESVQASGAASVQASPAGDIDGVTIGGVSPASTEK